MDQRILRVMSWMLNPPLTAPRVTTLIRVMVGAVFVAEAVMKFVFPDTLGPGRFEKLGLPAPDLMSPFDAVFEAGCGILLMLGLLTRLAAVPMIVDMIVAIVSTKVGLYFGTTLLPLPPVPPQTGFWAVLHEVRSEYAQILGTIYLLIAGPGRQSLDAWLARRRGTSAVREAPSLSLSWASVRSVGDALDWLLYPPASGPSAILLIRVMAGGVFLWEGVLKFVFPMSLGVRRFLLIGLPAPELLAPAIGVLEIVTGALLIVGLFTRPAAIILTADIIVAIVTTKIPLFLGTTRLPLPPVAPQTGFWALLHESRSDYAQLLFTLFLLVAGAGVWSVDAMLTRRRAQRRPTSPDAGRPGAFVPSLPSAARRVHSA
jgi:putative oxidoreductase